MKKIIALSLLIPFTINCSEKDEITIVARGIPEVRIPIAQMPLVADESGWPLWAGSLTLSGIALGGTAFYGYLAQPFPFSAIECETPYWRSLFEQSRETNHPCPMESGFRECIDTIVAKICDAKKITYDQQIPEKKVVAWTPFMVAVAATAGVQTGFLLGKCIGRVIRSKPAGNASSSNALEMEEV